jgi:S-layer homology domain
LRFDPGNKQEKPSAFPKTPVVAGDIVTIDKKNFPWLFEPLPHGPHPQSRARDEDLERRNDMRRSTSAYFLRKRAARGALLVVVAGAAIASGGCRCNLFPQALAVDPALSALSDGDLLFEPGETVAVEPSWAKKQVSSGPLCTTSFIETGTAASLTGPPGADYTITDTTADYGTFTSIGSIKSCAAAGNCYAMAVSAATRPVQHWDTTFTETLHGTVSRAKTWTLHVGDSFTDVPRSSPFYKKIETLLHNGITSGCTPTEYCPGQNVSRGEMAVFIARGIVGGDANLPIAGTVDGSAYNCTAGGVSLFTDVAPTDVFCKHVHYLATQNVMLGCSATTLCPSANVDRDEMAGFIAEAIVRPGGDTAVALAYGPDPVTGLSYSCDVGSPDIHFTDVPTSDPFCKHVHYLWAKGVVAGCSGDQYCPTVDVTRDAMSEFLVNAFGLKLYGPGTPIALPSPPVVNAPFFALAPCRLIDTRNTGLALAAGATRNFIVAGQCDIPLSAKAVSINVTATQPLAAGNLVVFPAGIPLPSTSTINYRAGQTRANNAIVQLGGNGDIQVFANQAAGTVQLILDVNGYFE